MNSDISGERADSALALGNSNNKRYPWAFVCMNIVTRALVQNINNAGKKGGANTQWLIPRAAVSIMFVGGTAPGCVYDACHCERSRRTSLKFRCNGSARSFILNKPNEADMSPHVSCSGARD